MALETSGFQLSQFDRAPAVSGNIGVVDTKGIYGAVVDALKAHEALRTTQQVQQMADAETAYRTAEAQGLLSQLPDTMAAKRAQSQLLASKSLAELPNVGIQAESDRARAILARDQALSDERLLGPKEEATAAEYKAKQVYQGFMADPKIALQRAMNMGLTKKQQDRAANLAVINDPNASEFARKAAMIAEGLEPKVLPPSLGYVEHVDSAGNSHLIVVDKRQAGMADLATGEALGSMAPKPSKSMAPSLGLLPQSATPPAAQPEKGLVPPAETPVAPAPTQARPAVSAFSPSQSKGQALEAKNVAELKEKLPTIKRALASFIQDNNNLNSAIQDAMAIIREHPTLSTSLGSLSKAIPGTPAYELKAALTTIQAKEAFATLAELRKNSPTGGALGNVSDREEQMLASAVASLDQGMSAEKLLANLERIAQFRADVRKNWVKAYNEDVQRASGAAPAPAPAASSDIDALVNKYRTK